MFLGNEMQQQAAVGLVAMALVAGTPGSAPAHCDTLSGPVIAAARRALADGNANHVLIWVQPGDEPEVKSALDTALAARRAGGPEQAAAELRFFETLVRVHRQGEGAPYTGIKPEGTLVGPAVEAADAALAAGNLEPARAVLVAAVSTGLERQFRAANERRTFPVDDVAAGRAYVKAYVEYTHFAEGLLDRATVFTAHHEHGATTAAGEHEAHAAAACDSCPPAAVAVPCSWCAVRTVARS